VKAVTVLALMDARLVPPEDVKDIDVQTAEWRMEYDVVSTLRTLGHHVHTLGVGSDLAVIRRAIEEARPDVVFNLLEDFHDVPIYDQNLVSYLELLHVSYTGCNPRGLMLARDKAISKTLLSFHRVRVPDFFVVRTGQAVRRPKRLPFPLIVKSLTKEGSAGIAQSSLVDDDARLAERVRFVHERLGTDAIVEQYVDGRELYVGVLGNYRLQVLPPWEIDFTHLPDDVPRIATDRVKWSPAYQKKRRISTGLARELPEGVAQRLPHLCKRIYRILQLSGYARIDFRLDAQGRLFVLEANPNPQLARGEDFAASAEHAGISYEALIQRLLVLGLRWAPDGQAGA
jgi:D-alanine-D-alanine ligase